MTDLPEYPETASRPSRNIFKWLFIITLLLLAGVLVYLFRSSMQQERLLSTRSLEYGVRIQKLESENTRLDAEVRLRNNQLKGFASYLPLIRNLQLADTAYRSLPFRYGQRIQLLPDSSEGIITTISVTAGELEYSVRYLIRNKQGAIIPAGISDIRAKE